MRYLDREGIFLNVNNNNNNNMKIIFAYCDSYMRQIMLGKNI